MERENKTLEYKENISKTYLKTVSAYANYNSGIIIFGIDDSGHILGLNNPQQDCLTIENQINDTIKPKPEYTLKINIDNTITLSVRKGFNTPYRYNGKAYTRNDSSTVEIDDLQEKRLILEGLNLNFEELSSNDKELSFEYLGNKLKEKLNISTFSLDILKSLNLYSDKNGYNNAAALLADTNNFLGLDIAVFGRNINEFKKRITLNNVSILKQYYESLKIYEEEYVFQKIENGFRKKCELVPYDAFREAIANAIIHRTWDIKANVKVEMYPDMIKISSPGGLISGMSEKDFLEGKFSYLRNPIIADTFYRLNIVEKFATGIRRINRAYENEIVKPCFGITENAISVTLPVISDDSISENEKKVYQALKNNYSYSRSEIENLTGFSKDTLIRILNSLIKLGLVIKEGKAKSVTYSKNVRHN